MGMVVSFVPRNPARNQRTMTSGELAPVIIFPGVRYEQVNGQASGEKISRTEAGEGAANPAH